MNKKVFNQFLKLSTPLVADACVRLNLPIRIAPSGIKVNIDKAKAAGRALPVRHSGSVDVFLEAMGSAENGDIMVIDNEGRKDEGCIGDLIVLEAAANGISAIVLWGTHRDHDEITEIGLPFFDYGTYPAGPRRLDPRHDQALLSVKFGDFEVSRKDIVFADNDGVIFVPADEVEEILNIAEAIQSTERNQAADLKRGNTLRQQLQFESYLKERSKNPSYTFRQHLRKIGGEIEE